MKKFWSISCIAVFIFVALVAVLGSLGEMRQEKLRQQPLLTRDDLNRLLQSSKAREQSEESGVNQPRAAESPATAPTLTKEIPHSLKGLPSEEQRREYFTPGKATGAGIAGIIGSSPVGGIIDIIAVAAGVPEGASWRCAEAHLTQAN